METKYKKWMAIFFLVGTIPLFVIALSTFWFDPSFQYRAPREGIYYVVADTMADYVNPGMIKNLDYDSILMGPSLVHNFNTADFADDLSLNVLKTSRNGAPSVVMKELLTLVFHENPQVKNVFYCLATNYTIFDDPFAIPSSMPLYLYDDNYFNDINYLLNKEIALNQLAPMLVNTLSGKPARPREEYYINRRPYPIIDKPAWIQNYTPPKKSENEIPDYIPWVQGNLAYNIIPFVEAYPDTTFIFYMSPEHILKAYARLQSNTLTAWIDAYELAAKTLLEFENVKIYNFLDVEEFACDLYNYYDGTHYAPVIPHEIVMAFEQDEHQITADNSEQTFQNMRSFFEEYDYAALFERYEISH